MVARSPPPSLRRGWPQFEFSLAGQACHWSLNGLPWQITLHSCPPTVEIKLCPVSASFVFSSLCLFLCLSSVPLPRFPLPLSSNSLNWGGLSRALSPRRLFEVKVGYGKSSLGKKKKRRAAEQLCCVYLLEKCMKAYCGYTVLHRQTLAQSCLSKHWHKHQHVRAHTHAYTQIWVAKQKGRSCCFGASWTASCCTCGPGLVLCLFAGDVVCVVVKVKGKHSRSSSDVWTCWECPSPPSSHPPLSTSQPAKQLDPLAVTGRPRAQLCPN